jgi:diguanylate cyclase (GGDEF)-like protein
MEKRTMNRSEEVEYFLLGYGLKIPGRGTSIGQLLQEAQVECKDCDFSRLLDALYNLPPDRMELKKYVKNNNGRMSAEFFTQYRAVPDWVNFFTQGSFNLTVLPPGRARYDELGEKLTAEHAKDSVNDDRTFARTAIDAARKSVAESDGKAHPLVGAVVVKNGQILGVAYRGEFPENHAEFIALEKKLSEQSIAGATVYTTLEPCTTRKYPKIPCAERLIERKVARVVMGMLDPDKRITGRGQRRLRDAGIITDLFPHDLMAEVEELNREFTRYCDRQNSASQPSADEVVDKSRGRADSELARCLDFLSDFSRAVISSLNPDEMLSTIRESLELGLSYSHIGVGLLEYSSREIVILTEAGCRTGAKNRRINLTENLLGRVARTGKMQIFNFPRSSSSEVKPIMEGSLSTIVLPLIYKDQLHGVFYVETEEIKDFSDKEIQLLTIVADLISGMLYNGMNFQIANEHANTDALTSVRSRRFFSETLQEQCSRYARVGESFALALFDLDGFKKVNDSLGHIEGDQLLVRLGHLLNEICSEDQMVARYGGDEFVVLIPGSDLRGAYEMVDRIRTTIAADDILLRRGVTGSFGIVSFPQDGTTPEGLLRAADEYVYKSKRAGGNCISQPKSGNDS